MQIQNTHINLINDTSIARMRNRENKSREANQQIKNSPVEYINEIDIDYRMQTDQINFCNKLFRPVFIGKNIVVSVETETSITNIIINLLCMQSNHNIIMTAIFFFFLPILLLLFSILCVI